jgi:hypothetical protein
MDHQRNKRSKGQGAGGRAQSAERRAQGAGRRAQGTGHRLCRPEPSSESEALAKDSAKAWHRGRKRWAGSSGRRARCRAGSREGNFRSSD